MKPVLPEDRERVALALKQWRKTAANRKKIRKELWGMIGESLPEEKVVDVREELGLEF